MYKFKNIIVVLILVFITAMCLVSCDNSSNKSLSVDEIIDNILFKDLDSNLDSVADFNNELFKNNCEKLYGIDYDRLIDGAVIYSSDSLCADEVSILKEADEKSLLEVLENRAKRRLKDFQGYSPSEAKKIENHIVFQCGGYDFLIISDNAEEIENEIKDIVK